MQPFKYHQHNLILRASAFRQQEQRSRNTGKQEHWKTGTLEKGNNGKQEHLKKGREIRHWKTGTSENRNRETWHSKTGTLTTGTEKQGTENRNRRNKALENRNTGQQEHRKIGTEKQEQEDRQQQGI